MNIQAVICSFVLAIGAVLICVTTRTADDDGEIKGKPAKAVLIIGIILVVLGALGYIFTIYEVIKRGHEKLAKGHMRRLEKQVYDRQVSGVSQVHH